MQELEKLFNTLIKRGWKPAGFPGQSEIKITEGWGVELYMDTKDVTVAVKIKLRNLVSLESGLWQFVCDKKLFNKDPDTLFNSGGNIKYNIYDYQYRLLESVLIPEEELAKFLIENIKL